MLRATNKAKQKAHLVASPLEGPKEFAKRNFPLKEGKSKEGEKTEAGREFQSLPEKEMND